MSSSHAHSHGHKDAAHHGIPVITIDGPTASGKGTVAARVAQRLGFHYLDSGVLYRLVAMKLVQEGEDGANEDAAVRAAQTLEPEFLPDGRIMLSGEDVSAAIRADGIGLQASRLAVHPAVREALNVLQHRARRARAGGRRPRHGHRGLSGRPAQGLSHGQRAGTRRAPPQTAVGEGILCYT